MTTMMYLRRPSSANFAPPCYFTFLHASLSLAFFPLPSTLSKTSIFPFLSLFCPLDTTSLPGGGKIAWIFMFSLFFFFFLKSLPSDHKILMSRSRQESENPFPFLLSRGWKSSHSNQIREKMPVLKKEKGTSSGLTI